MRLQQMKFQRVLKKNIKTFWENLVLNEYIKNTECYYSDIYETLFNVVFNSGIIPESWLIGNIKPIYNNKDDKMNPKNFRPITILSCLSKLFTAVLSERLTKLFDAFLLLNENQFGFRREYSAIDNLFIHSLKFRNFKRKKCLCLYWLQRPSILCIGMLSGVSYYWII
jgi:hypothetical protein